jgi:hypothetical protein
MKLKHYPLDVNQQSINKTITNKEKKTKETYKPKTKTYTLIEKQGKTTIE